MTDEELEFRISQYTDGTLPAEEVAALEAELAGDAEARAMLESYRKLDAALKRELPLPAVKWDRLAGHLSDAVADSVGAHVTIKLFTWSRVARVAVAAMILIVIGSAIYWQARPAPRENVVAKRPELTTLAAVVEVSGPAIEASAQPAVVEIAIGPSPLAQRQALNYAAAEDIIYRAPRVVIASTYVKRQDSPSLPF